MPSILKSSVHVSVFLVLNILANFAVEAGLAAILGASTEMDVYLAAVVVPEYLILLLQAGIQFSLVPILVRLLENGEQKQVAGVIDTTLVALAVCFLGIFLTGSFFAEKFASVLAPGFSAEQTPALANLLPIIIPGALFRVAALTLASLFYARKKFLLPASVPFFGASLQFVLVLFAVPIFRAEAAAAAFVCNHVLQFLILFAVYQQHRAEPMQIDFRLPVFKKTLQAMWPLILGAVFFRAIFLVDRFIASGFDEGSITRLTYATKIVIVLITTGVSGFVTVMFPELSKLIASKQWARLRSINRSALTALFFMTMFFWLVMVYFGETLIALFLERGKFTAGDTTAVASLVVTFGGMLVFGSVGAYASNLFFAAEDTRTPTIIGFCGFWLSTALKFYLAPKLNVQGIAIATTILYTMNALAMMWLLQRKAALFDLRQIANDCIKICISAVLAGIVFHRGVSFIKIMPWANMLLVTSLAGIVYLSSAYYLNLGAVEIIFRRIGLKIRLSASKS